MSFIPLPPLEPLNDSLRRTRKTKSQTCFLLHGDPVSVLRKLSTWRKASQPLKHRRAVRREPSYGVSSSASAASPAAASDDTGPGGAPALPRGAGLSAVGGTTGGIAEGVAEGHRA